MFHPMGSGPNPGTSVGMARAQQHAAGFQHSMQSLGLPAADPHQAWPGHGRQNSETFSALLNNAQMQSPAEQAAAAAAFLALLTAGTAQGAHANVIPAIPTPTPARRNAGMATLRPPNHNPTPPPASPTSVPGGKPLGMNQGSQRNPTPRLSPSPIAPLLGTSTPIPSASGTATPMSVGVVTTPANTSSSTAPNQAKNAQQQPPSDPSPSPQPGVPLRAHGKTCKLGCGTLKYNGRRVGSLVEEANDISYARACARTCAKLMASADAARAEPILELLRLSMQHSKDLQIDKLPLLCGYGLVATESELKVAAKAFFHATTEVNSPGGFFVSKLKQMRHRREHAGPSEEYKAMMQTIHLTLAEHLNGQPVDADTAEFWRDVLRDSPIERQRTFLSILGAPEPSGASRTAAIQRVAAVLSPQSLNGSELAGSPAAFTWGRQTSVDSLGSIGFPLGLNSRQTSELFASHREDSSSAASFTDFIHALTQAGSRQPSELVSEGVDFDDFRSMRMDFEPVETGRSMKQEQASNKVQPSSEGEQEDGQAIPRVPTQDSVPSVAASVSGFNSALDSIIPYTASDQSTAMTNALDVVRLIELVCKQQMKPILDRLTVIESELDTLHQNQSQLRSRLRHLGDRRE